MRTAGVLDVAVCERLWRSVGRRNVLVHEYVRVDLDLVAAAVTAATQDYGDYVADVAGVCGSSVRLQSGRGVGQARGGAMDGATPVDASADEWWTLEQRLGRFLRALRDREVLVIEVKGTARYVQFMSWGDQGIHGEVSYEGGVAGQGEDERVLALGWEPPVRDRKGRSVTGTDNLQLDMPPEEGHRLAGMTVAVLRDVWGADSPNALSTKKVVDVGGPAIEELNPP